MNGSGHNGAVAVIGGGVAGLQAALDLSEFGIRAVLIEQGPSVGGIMAQLDKTFPTNDCSLCILSPKMVEVARNKNIEIHTLTEVTGIEGRPGDFQLKLTAHPRYVDLETCTGCGICVERCPVKIQDPFDEHLGLTRSIRVPFPQAVPQAAVIDRKTCTYYIKKGKCKVCEKVCTASAIRFDDREREFTLQVGSVIVAAGAGCPDPSGLTELGYGRFPDVVTALELERITCASGPTQGHVTRRSDGQVPESVAFLQCAGSRDVRHRPYCSAVCCSHSIKQALVIREHHPEIKFTFYMMDLRSVGKHFEPFARRILDADGVKWVRGRACSVEQTADQRLRIRAHTEDGGAKTAVHDLAVLATGLEPPKGLDALAARLGLERDEWGFLSTDPRNPVDTSRPGIFACGSCTGPRDIPESVTGAQAAAVRAVAAAALVSPAAAVRAAAPAGTTTGARPGAAPRAEKPDPGVATPAAAGEPPRIGVLVCRCGTNIGGTVDVDAVAEHVRPMDHVVWVKVNTYSCSQEAQQLIIDAIREHRLNRLVVAACTPRTHEPLFRETVRQAGLNPYLFEMANIRDQCSWVHQKEPDRATRKSCHLTAMAVAKAALLEPLAEPTVAVTDKALVIGGGPAGMAASLELARTGHPVVLVEREHTLGGMARKLTTPMRLAHGELDPARLVADLEQEVRSSERIRVETSCRLESVDGYIGQFRVRALRSDGTTLEDTVGAVVVATGAVPHQPSSFLRGECDAVITQEEMEEALAGGSAGFDKVAFVQCVESRNAERNYCSKVCCLASVKQALEIKRTNPKATVWIFYRDLRTYGLLESLAEQARRQGVEFWQYDPERPPELAVGNGGLELTAHEPMLGRPVVIRPDRVVLASGMDRPEGLGELSRMLKVPLDSDGFMLEAHVKLQPTQFATDGVFLCGTAQAPKNVYESVLGAQAAAGKAAALLGHAEVVAQAAVAEVRGDKCVQCGLCVEICPYNAPQKDPATSVVSVTAVLCKGCGLCAAACPNRAIEAKGFTEKQLEAQADVAVTGGVP